MNELPTAKLEITWPKDLDFDDPEAVAQESMRQIHEFAQALKDSGVRPWFEVWYPAPSHLDDVEKLAWELRQPDTFDALELKDDGTIHTLPPYSELIGGD